MHRQRLAISIKGRVYDRSPVFEKADEDIAAIQAGLKRFTATNQAVVPFLMSAVGLDGMRQKNARSQEPKKCGRARLSSALVLGLKST